MQMFIMFSSPSEPGWQFNSKTEENGLDSAENLMFNDNLHDWA
jgi:hypothetical protein